jgi:hypothetical protein
MKRVARNVAITRRRQRSRALAYRHALGVINGINGFKIFGSWPYEFAGLSVASAGACD